MSADLASESRRFTDLQRRWASIDARAPRLLDTEYVSRLRADELRLRSTGRWVAGPTTLLEVLRLQHDEVRNCRIVRWLLDPLAPHGIGAEALRLTLERVNDLALEQGLEPQQYPGAEHATLIVEEARGNTRADIVIDGPTWLAVIEAKIHAGEQEDQGRRLSELWPNATYVYLTRRGGAMATAGEEPWINMRWDDLLGAVARAASGTRRLGPSSPASERARRAVQDYLHAARRLAK